MYYIYTPVICNHGPQALRNSRDFDFLSSKNPAIKPALRGQPVDKTPAVMVGTLGAVSFFGGVTRLTMAVTVIMVGTLGAVSFFGGVTRLAMAVTVIMEGTN